MTRLSLFGPGRMRPVSMLPALALAAALFPASALARRAAVTSQGCTVTLQAASSTIAAGEAASLTGSLSCPDAASAAEQTVTLYQRTAGTHGFAVAATTTTEADGSYRFGDQAMTASSVFYVGSDGATSARLPIAVLPAVTLSGPAEGTQLLALHVRRGADAALLAQASVTFTGTVGPDDAGAVVVLQRTGSAPREAWRRIGAGVVDAEGNYSISHTFLGAGQATVRVVVHRHAHHPASASAPLTYVIVRAPRAPRAPRHAASAGS